MSGLFLFQEKRKEALLHLYDSALVEIKCLLKLSVMDGVCLCHLGCWEILSPVPWTSSPLDVKICLFYSSFVQLLRTKVRVV